jgi:Trypsin-like peptidase domain
METDMRILIPFLPVLLFVCQPTAVASAQCRSASLVAENTTVMVNGSFAVGAGIIMAVRGSNIYVATAKHVVNESGLKAASITVKFRTGEKASVKNIHKAPSKDLAFLLIENSELAEKLQQKLSWQILRSRSARRLSSGRELAIIVGQGAEKEWSRPLEPEPIGGQKADLIEIQSTTIQPGFSGGGVFDPTGLLIGVITTDTGSMAEAITIEAALSEARRLKLPVDLSEIDLTPVPIFIAPVTGVPEDWGQLIRDNLRHKLELQLERRGFRLLDCESGSRAIGIFGAVEVQRTSFTTDVAIVRWQFNHLSGLANTPTPQRLEFVRLPWTDIWVKDSARLLERADEVGEYAVMNFMKEFP